MKFAVPAVLLAIMAGFFIRGFQLNPRYVESPLIGKPAPAFELPDLRNPDTTVSTSDFGGEYALLNVWATWCVECRREHNFLLQLKQSGMPIYGLNWKDDRASALAWLETLGNPYVASAEDQIGRVAIDYGVYGAPETFLLAPDLTILEKYFGPLNEQVWERLFVPAIEEHREQG